MKPRKALLQTTALAGVAGGMFLSTAAMAADLYVKAPLADVAAPLGGPAVDGINGKLDGFGGSIANRSIYGSRGAVSVPLGGQFGVQVDGAGGSFDSRTFGSVAGHLFWRDPAQALFGLYVSHTHWDSAFGGVDVNQVAAEGEYYWARWTLQGIVGAEFGNSAFNTFTSVAAVGGGGTVTSTFVNGIDVRTRFMDQINLKYYFADNWAAYIGHRYLGGKNALALGSEAALPLGHGVLASAFVEGRVGEGEFHGIWGGLRFYFGQKDKPLIARQRQDDPINDWGTETLFSIMNSTTPGSSGSTITCPVNRHPQGGICVENPG